MKLIGILALIPLLSNVAAVYDLRTEHLVEPIGVDATNPRFSWKNERAEETGCRISVTDKEGNILWDEAVNGNSAIYAGPELQPFTEYTWKVACKDSEAASTFETGMKGSENWRGQWISDNNSSDYRPAGRFRKEFEAEGRIVKARAYIAAAGLHTILINGRTVEPERVLDPAFTRHDRRILYSTFDITDMLKEGANAVGVELGNGWYNHQSATTWHFDRAPWRARPAFCMDIRLSYADGHTETVCTGADWKTSSDGPVRFNNIYVGEHHDLRRDQKGWAGSAYDDSLWDAVILRSCPAQNIASQMNVPIRESEVIEPVEIKQLRTTKWIYDFGVNMAGNVKFTAKGKRGTVVTLKYAERLNVEGRCDQTNIDCYYFGDNAAEPFQTDIITLGGGDDSFSPRYSYKGFRYVEITSSAPVEMKVWAVKVNSDVAAAGAIETSDKTISAIWKAANNSYLSNLMGYPTDCPQREKNGWTGDAHIAVETGLFNYDAFTVYEKWMADHRDEQQPCGVLPDIIPTCGWGYWSPKADGNGLDWTSTIAIIPWELYLFSGDAKPLRECYDNIKRYVEYALTLCNEEQLVCWGRGDWVPVTKKTDKTLICSCFLYKDLTILSEAAKMFGKEDDYRKYSALAAQVKDAVNGKYLDAKTGIYADGLQTAQSLPLYFGMVPQENVKAVAAALAERVKKDNCHINAGVHGTKAVLHALSDNGYTDLAYKMASATDFPSWGHWVTNGRTTLVENWRLDAGKDNSDNHIMFGDISAWFYRSLGGINPDPAQPGFKHIIIKPDFPKGLKDFKCSYESPYGLISTAWTRKGNKISLTVTIPAGSSATLVKADGTAEELTSGTHSITVKQ